MFDSFTGAPAKKAAAQNTQLYRDAAANNASTLNQGSNNNIGWIEQGYGNNAGALNNLQTQGTAALDKGYAGASDATHNAINAYSPLSAVGNKYGAAGDMYLDALGVNGAGGNARATSAFQAGPGYQWQVDQATDAAARKAASLGVAAGGNTLDAITRLGSNLANQEYGNYLTRLGDAGKTGIGAMTTAAGGQANGWNSLANLFTGDASNRINLAGNVATGTVANNNQLTGNLVNNQNMLSTGLITGQNDMTAGITNANNQAAQAQQQGNKNMWDFGMNGAKTAAQVAMI